jgi:hypothetical protein
MDLDWVGQSSGRGPSNGKTRYLIKVMIDLAVVDVVFEKSGSFWWRGLI